MREKNGYGEGKEECEGCTMASLLALKGKREKK